MKNDSHSRATSKDGSSNEKQQPAAKPKSSFLMLAAAAARELSRTWETRKQPVTLESNLSNGKGGSPSPAVSGDTHKMSAVEHQATVDKGLKMKIKRKGVGVQKPDSAVVKTEPNVDSKNSASMPSCSSNGVVSEKAKHGVTNDKDKSPKQKGNHKRKDVKGKIADGLSANSDPMTALGSCPEPKEADLPNIKKECSVDPYEFNAKVEDGISVPVKKMKSEKIDMGSSPVHPSVHDVSVETCDISVATEPECLGPCEPGTSVTLEGIVWHETENGVLVINVTWRGKTYVGTLLDATRHDWAPPRFNCDSPVSDIETRTPKGRGKRGRGVATPVNERISSVEGRNLRKNRRGSAQTFTAPASPAKSDISVSGGVKRKGRPTDLDLEKCDAPKSKRSCSTSRHTPTVESPLAGMFECPEKNCHKKYRQLSGLKYHQSKFHPENGQSVSDIQGEDDKDDEEEDMEQESEKETQPSPVKESSKKQSSKEKSVDSKSDNSASTSEDKTSETNNNSQKSDNTKETKVKSETPKKMETSKPKMDIPNKQDVLPKKKEPTSIPTSVPTSCVSEPSVIVTSTVVASTSSVVSVTPTTVITPPHVYQISTASVAISTSTSVTTHHSGQIVPPVLSAVSTHSQAAAIPITVTAITGVSSPSEVTKTEAKYVDKSKVKPPNRPIVPAPSPQMIALTTNVSVTHTNLAPVSTHTQMSPSLKPIQPKPTIMGEPSINPALVSLKEKKAKQKKLKPKEKEGSGVSPPSSCNVQSVVNLSANVKHIKEPLKEEHTKYDRPAVIKSVPSPAKPIDVSSRKDMPSSALDMSSHRPVTLDTSRTTVATTGVIMSQIPPKMLDVQAAKPQATHPASLLKVHSPMSESRKTPTGSSVNDNVQSPAYSDISDANESGSPQGESPQKTRDEPIRKKEESNVPPQATTEASNVQSHYGMYGYYGQQPPYYMGNNVNPQMVQNSPKNPNQPSNKDDAKPSNTPKVNNNPPRPGMVPDEAKKIPNKEVSVSSEKAAEDGKPRPVDAQNASPLTPQKMQEYQMQHQKWVQQQMYALQTLPPHAQYQYLAQYGYALDSNYHMHMMSTDPAYRQYYERALTDEQKKGISDQLSKMEVDNTKAPDTQSLPANIEHRPPNDPSNSAYSRNPSAPTVGSEKSQDLRKVQERSSERPKSVESKDNLREKLNENHQILKENIELKSQMDSRPRYEGGVSSYEAFRLKQEEVRRHQMYLQQKQIEQQKSEEKRKQESASKPPELRSAESVVTPKSMIPKPGIDLTKTTITDCIKKEVGEKLIKEPHTNKDNISNIKLSGDNKKVEEKNKHIDKSKSITEAPPKLRPTPSASNVVGGSTAVSSSLPASSSSSSSIQTAYGGGGGGGNNMYYPYNMPSNYGQGQYEQQSLNRNLNVNPVLNYSGFPHPTTPVGGYGLTSSERELEKEKCGSSGSMQKQLPSPAVIEPDSKSSDIPSSHHASPQVYGSHKIHELQEKNRLPLSAHKSSSSPFPQKTADNVSAPSSPHPSLDKLREYTNSPPTQRHVHTHTHTHFVGGFPNIYDQYNAAAMFVPPQQPSTTVAPTAAAAAAATANTAQPYSSPPK